MAPLRWQQEILNSALSRFYCNAVLFQLIIRINFFVANNYYINSKRYSEST